MIPRYQWLLLGWVVGVLPGLWLESAAWTALGCGLATAIWLAWHEWRQKQLRRWLRSEQWQTPPDFSLPEGFVADKVRKLHRQLSQEVAEHQGRLDEFLSAIQASPNGVLLLDGHSRIEWCNATAAAHLGIDAQRDVMQHINNLIRDPAFLNHMARGDHQQEISINAPTASPSKPQFISVRLHAYGKDRKLLLTRDVTAIQQAEAMRRDFVANVSHEIRTPLTVLSGFVETLQSLPVTQPERDHYLDLMALQAQRMQTLVNDLLTLSKLEGSPIPNRAEAVCVADLLNQSLSQAKGLSAIIAQGQHQFDVVVPAPNTGLLGHESELHSALTNLLSNAVRYTPAGGHIQVGFKCLPSGEGVLWVTDTGPGISSEHLPRLTERFYRVDRSRSRETGGTGLGLAIVKHVIQRHGGRIGIESQVGHGSTFSLYFPADRVKPQ